MKKYKNVREFGKALGLSEDYIQLAKLKTKMTLEIIKGVEAKNLTHQELANLSGVPRSAITGIINGSLQKVTIDRLIRILFALGRNVELKIKIAV